jgi:hypothetical protein
MGGGEPRVGVRLAVVEHGELPRRAGLEVVDEEAVVREEDVLGLLVQGTAGEEEGRGRRPALARQREGGVAAAAEAAVGRWPAAEASANRAMEELGAVLLVGGVAEVGIVGED